MSGGFCGFTRAELDREYSPSSLVPSLDAYLREYAARSDTARRHGRPITDLRYGDAPEATLDLFTVDSTVDSAQPVPLLVFVHGGFWQQVSKEESEFAATGLTSAGIAFAAIDYGLAPRYRLDEIVAMTGQALDWLHRNAGRYGIDPGRIHLAGSSAGAHLAAMHLGDERVAGAILLSGVYDLQPLRHSYVNDALGLSLDDAVRNSPVHHLPKRLPPVVIARGGNETGEFIRQHDTMAALLRQRTQVTEVISTARDHFDLAYDLGDPDTALGAAVLARITAPDAVLAADAGKTQG